MFVYSLRASTLKFIGVVCVALAALIVLIVFVPSYEPSSSASAQTETVSYDKIKTNDDRVNFLSQFGWSVESEPEESASVTIPKDFDKVFAGYNEIQKQQGLDLGKYKNKDMMRYTYVITNYDGYSGKVYANILVYKNRVVGGDICSADSDGFIHGLRKTA